MDAATPVKSRKAREEPAEDAEEHLDSSDSPAQENIPLAKEDPDDEIQQPEEAGLEVHAEENNEFDENDDSKVPDGDDKDEADEKLDNEPRKKSSAGSLESQGDKKDDEKENDADESKPVESVNVWISCLPHSTKAAELKKLCSKCGKISSAKIVTNAKSPKSGCYGYVTMSTLEDAKKCVAELNESEYNGHKLAVEMTDLDPAGALRASASRKKAAAKKESEQQKEQQQQQQQSPKKKVISLKRDPKEKKKEEGDEVIAVDLDIEGKDDDKTKTRRDRSRDRGDVRKRLGARIPTSSSTKVRGRSGRIVSRRGGRGSFRGSRPGGERMPASRSSGSFRDRHDSRERKRELERRQRDEMYRLEREREKIRLEREKLAQEKLELLKIERDRQRAERARIQHEREALMRRKLDVTRPPKRTYEESRSGGSDYYGSRKKEFDRRRDDSSVASKRPRDDYARGSTSSYGSSSREVSRSSYGSSAGTRNGYSGSDYHSGSHHNHHSSSHHSSSSGGGGGGGGSHSRGEYSSSTRDGGSASYKWTNPKWSSSAHQSDYPYSSSSSNYGTMSRGYGSTSSSSSRRY